MANRSKLDAFILELEEGQVMQRAEEVEVGGTITSSLDVPVLTGIPLIIGRKPTLWLEKLEAHWVGLTPKIQRAQFKQVKAIRVAYSFMVSKFDYVASGFPLKKEWIQRLQSKVNSLFCGLFGLSDRTAHLRLYLPVQFGGLGCPWLALRADLRFLHQAMQLSYMRSGICRAVGDEI